MLLLIFVIFFSRQSCSALDINTVKPCYLELGEDFFWDN